MNNMNIKLEKVRLEDRNKLERLLQLYLHDLSLYFPITFNSDICQYEYDLDKYFIDNYAYFIKSDKDILGFVLIDDNGNNNYIEKYTDKYNRLEIYFSNGDLDD